METTMRCQGACSTMATNEKTDGACMHFPQESRLVPSLWKTGSCYYGWTWPSSSALRYIHTAETNPQYVGILRWENAQRGKNSVVVKTMLLGGNQCMHAKSLQSHLTLCDPMNHSPPGSSVHGISHTRTLEWVAMLPSKWSSQPRDRIWHLFCLLHWQAGSIRPAPPEKQDVT